MHNVTKNAKFILKAGFSIFLLVVIYRSVDLNSVYERFVNIDLYWLSAAVVALLMQIFVLAYRWSIVMNVLGAGLGVKTTTRIIFIAQFFNQAFPSTVGGDAVRMWLTQRAGIGLRPAVQGVVADRAIATAVLLAFVIVGLPFQDILLLPPSVQFTANIFAGSALLCFFALVLMSGYLSVLFSKFRALRIAFELMVTVREVLSSRRETTIVLALSVLNHVLSIVGIVLLAKSLNMNQGFMYFFVLVPFVTLLSMIPVSIGGWGLREGIMIAALGYIDVSRDLALGLSLLFGVVTAVISLPGGVLWLLGKKNRAAQVLSLMDL